jgi:puromycin-sensitive aminopeptidase
MLERWLGADAFRAGVRHYLARYRLGNTETTDLWDALEEATGRPVRRIMDTWIFQPGFPTVRADDGRLLQRRFSYTGDAPAQHWVLPVLARVHADGRAETHSLLVDADAVPLEVPASSLVVLNAGGEGFYRVAYSAEARDRLLDAGVLDPLERFALVDDLWAAVLAGDATAAEFLACVRRLTGETDPVVWRVMIGHFRSAMRLVEGDALERMRTELAALVRPALERIGWEVRDGDDARTRQLRGLFVGALGSSARDAETIARAREVYARGAADADVQSASIAVVAGNGGRDEFEEFLTRAARSSNPQEELRYLYALGDFPTEALALRASQLGLSDDVRSQNGPFVVQRALRNREHGAAVWASLRDNWERAVTRFSPSLMTRVIEGTTWLVDDAVADDVMSFVESHPLATGSRTVAQQMDRLRVHRATVARERARFTAALLGNG